MWNEGFWSSGMWIFPMIMMIVMLIVVSRIFGQGGFRPPWGHGGGRHEGGQGPSAETPLELLKRRYAKGEITREEFEQMKEDLLK